MFDRPCVPFIFASLRIRIDGAPPVLVRCRFFRFLSRRARSSRVGVATTRRLRQAGQIGLVVESRPHDAPHRGVRLQRGRVDPDRRALDHARRDEACCTQVNTVRCVSTSIRRRVREMVEWSGTASSTAMPKKRRIASESAARQAMIAPSQCLQSTRPTTRENRCRRETRPATSGGIEPLALPFDERIEAVGVQQGVHSTIERMGDRLGQVGRGDPEGFLSSACASGAHGHANENKVYR